MTGTDARDAIHDWRQLDRSLRSDVRDCVSAGSLPANRWVANIAVSYARARLRRPFGQAVLVEVGGTILGVWIAAAIMQLISRHADLWFFVIFAALSAVLGPVRTWWQRRLPERILRAEQEATAPTAAVAADPG